MEAWVQFQHSACGICGGQWNWDRFFFKHFSFPLPIIIPTVIHTHFSLGAGIIGQFEAIIQLLLLAFIPKIIMGHKEIQYLCSVVYSSGRKMKGNKCKLFLETEGDRDRRKSVYYPEEEGIMNL
jgi:hypothetical protein